MNNLATDWLCASQRPLRKRARRSIVQYSEQSGQAPVGFWHGRHVWLTASQPGAQPTAIGGITLLA